MINSIKKQADNNAIEAVSPVDIQVFVLDSPVPVVVEFTFEWCGSCLKVRESLLKLKEKYQGQVVFYTVDICSNSKLAESYGVDLFPTLLFFKNGEVKGSISGTVPVDSINKMLLSLF